MSFVEVPVKLIDNGLDLSCMMVTGQVGARIGGSTEKEDIL